MNLAAAASLLSDLTVAGRHTLVARLREAVALAERAVRDADRVRRMNEYLNATATHAQASATEQLLTRRALACEVEALLEALRPYERVLDMDVRVAMAMVGDRMGGAR